MSVLTGNLDGSLFVINGSPFCLIFFLYPKNDRLLNNYAVGNEHETSQDDTLPLTYTKSLEYYQKAIDIDPSCLLYYNNLANLYEYKLKNIELSYSIYTKCIDVNKLFNDQSIIKKNKLYINDYLQFLIRNNFINQFKKTLFDILKLDKHAIQDKFEYYDVFCSQYANYLKDEKNDEYNLDKSIKYLKLAIQLWEKNEKIVSFKFTYLSAILAQFHYKNSNVFTLFGYNRNTKIFSPFLSHVSAITI